MKKTFFKRLSGFILMILCAIVGGTDVMMAAGEIPDGGTTHGGNAGNNNGVTGVDTPGSGAGIATETQGRQDNPDMYMDDVDQRIVKIRPMATPIDQISRYAKSRPCDSFVVKYYSVGTRPIMTKLTNKRTVQTSGTQIELEVDDAEVFQIDDTIRVVNQKAEYDHTGHAYDKTSTQTPDLVLWVVGRKTENGNPIVCAVNGLKQNGTGPSIWVPEIAAGTTLIRMGKACGELDVQTSRFNNNPMPETQFCQNFMIQIEVSTFDKIAKKEVNWTFTDQEEDAIYDMRLTQENSFIWGDMNSIAHNCKEGMLTWFTKGIWWMPKDTIDVGHYNATSGVTEISDDDLVDISKRLNVGTGVGNKRKILLCGSDMLAAFSKIKSEKFRLKDTVEIWNLKFKSWDTDFGEILTIHHELFDMNDMSDCGLAIDPEYLTKRTHVSWSRNVLDLKKAGVRNTDAAVLQEVACLYLRYPKAHARMRLAPKPVA